MTLRLQPHGAASNDMSRDILLNRKTTTLFLSKSLSQDVVSKLINLLEYLDIDLLQSSGFQIRNDTGIKGVSINAVYSAMNNMTSPYELLGISLPTEIMIS